MSGASFPQRADVVIIGGGAMGASIAFHLAEAGVEDVLLIDQGSFGGGSTSKSAGGVRAQFSAETNIRLGARSLVAFEEFGERPGAEIDLHQVGYLFLHSDPGRFAEAQAAVALQNSLGIDSRILTADEAAELSPAVDVTGVIGATFHERDGYCSPEAVVMGYIAGARRRGAIALSGVAAQGIDVVDGSITGVQTSEGFVQTNAVICAAGAWSRSIAQLAGIVLPVDPLRRQIVVSEPLDPALLELCPDTTPMTIDATSTFYFHREGPGILMGMSFRGETPGFRDEFSDDWLPALTEAMERRAPSLMDIGIAHRWTGYYEVTPDDNALIGEIADVSRFLYSCGFSGHGFLQAPAVGETMRDVFLGREPMIDVRPLDVRRFEQGAGIHELGIV
jgi:sarcosine oxidase, subunit beta